MNSFYIVLLRLICQKLAVAPLIVEAVSQYAVAMCFNVVCWCVYDCVVVYFQEMRKNEVFVDIIERLTVVLEADVSLHVDSC